jgi:transcriptional regulator with PAS, ATPase and Fis domain
MEKIVSKDYKVPPKIEIPVALKSLKEVEKEQILRVLMAEPNLAKAAEHLGITTVTLWRKRLEYGLTMKASG